MTDLLITDRATTAIGNFVRQPGHALLVSGGRGMGKYSAALEIARQLLNKQSIEELLAHPYFFQVGTGLDAIGIDQIREIKNDIKLKTTGTDKVRRVVVVENADAMTHEAQNSILKILEEPPIDTVIILTAHNDKALKPTILSRVQLIRLETPSLEHAQRYFQASGIDATKIEPAYILSNGAPALMYGILSDDSENELLSLVDETKKLLSSTRFEKLLLVDQYAKSKDLMKNRIFVLKRISRAALIQATQRNNTDLVKYWHKVLREIQAFENNLNKGGNIKLLLTNLFVKL